MGKKINKINNLKKAEGFLQLNYSRGFKYVDKAGEFMNHLYEGERFPNHVMDATGMAAKIDEKTLLKVSPHNLWMRFVEPDTFDYQKREFLGKAALVNSIFQPEKYTRMGWRIYFIYECGDNYPNIIPENYIGNDEFNEIVFTKKIGKFTAKINISKMMEETTKKKVILFDMDLSIKEDVSGKDFNVFGKTLDEMENIYKSDTLLDLINNVLK